MLNYDQFLAVKAVQAFTAISNSVTQSHILCHKIDENFKLSDYFRFGFNSLHHPYVNYPSLLIQLISIDKVDLDLDYS